jgi:hypothetical protein
METPVTTDVPQEIPAQSGPSGDSLDTMLEKYFPVSESTATPDDVATPQPDDTDTLEGHPGPVEGVLDTEAGDEGGEEPGEEESQEDELEPQDEDPEIDALLAADEGTEPDTSEESFLTEFHREKFLKEHPDLEKPYKSMQAHFSRRMGEIAKVERESKQLHAEATGMKQQLEAFQKQLQDDGSFEDFLVRVSLNRPEVVERAYERVISLTEDEGKKKEFLKDQELTETKARLREREELDARRAREQRVAEVVDLTQRVALRLGLKSAADLEVAEQYVANQINHNAANGDRDITPQQIVAAVKRASQALQRKQEGVRKSVRREVRQEELKTAQDRLRAPRRPAPPNGSAPAPALPAPQRIVNTPKKEPLEQWLEQKLGVEL